VSASSGIFAARRAVYPVLDNVVSSRNAQWPGHQRRGDESGLDVVLVAGLCECWFGNSCKPITMPDHDNTLRDYELISTGATFSSRQLGVSDAGIRCALEWATGDPRTTISIVTCWDQEAARYSRTESGTRFGLMISLADSG